MHINQKIMNVEKNEIFFDDKFFNNIQLKTNDYIFYKRKSHNKIEKAFNNCIYLCKSNLANYNSEYKKKRNPGVDLVRLIASYCIVFTHYLLYGKAFNKFNKYKMQLMTFDYIIGWHNNSFALISGIIGYKINRYSNLLYLWFTVFFYSVGIHLYIIKFKKNYIVKTPIAKELFPIIYQRYWYFTAYFGMYLFLPVINKGISVLTKYEFKLMIISIHVIFVIWKDIKNTNNDVFILNGGFSLLWLLIMYLTGAYIGKYMIIYSGLKKYVFCFKCIFIYAFLSFIFIKLNNEKLNLENGYFQNEIILFLKKIFTKRFDSLSKINQSIVVCLLFLQMDYNKYIQRIISCLGPLAFGVYLIHHHQLLISNYLSHIFDKDSNNINLQSTIIIVIVKPLKIYIFCLIIDYIRNKCFYIFRIKKACIFLENKLNKIFI